MVKICNNTYPIENTKYIEKFNDYPFELDHFQKYAVEGIEEGKHILITAHTASGKTIAGEHAIQKFCNEGKKVIYTSPIKSLSNQKYYEFSRKFPEISFGILTGDIKFNPEADCLIMTTEILRNTLFEREDTVHKDKYKDKDKYIQNLHFDMDIENELACVIFDEVHYINDADRGKVWEETIIKMPKQVQLVMLSATIDRSHEFAKWIEVIKEREVWLASTDIRVVPLTHYSYYQMNQEVYKKTNDKKTELLLRGIDNEFIPIKQQHNTIDLSVVETLKKCDYYVKKKRIFIKHQHVLNNVIKQLHTKNMLPAICFVFSRKNVEKYANSIEMSLFNEDETHYPNLIEKECKGILRKLPNYREYINMPEFINMVKLLEQGIAIHHSGIMPILREMVELLFSKGYIKLLFATETFAVGINMPTKTVLFTSLKKFDGSTMRYLLPHEYTQMAGRAGRRGLDTTGHVIHLNNMFDIPEKSDYKHILSGNAQTLVSKFKIHFNIILKLISINEDSFNTFVHKSMMGDELKKELIMLKNKVIELKNKQHQFEDTLTIMQSSLDDIKRVHSIQEIIHMVKPKKKKQLHREMTQINQSTKSFESDYQKYKEYLAICKDVKKYEEEERSCELFVNSNIQMILDILSENGFIRCIEDKNTNSHNSNPSSNPSSTYRYELTLKGIIANSLQEVNGLCFAELLMNEDFNDCTPQELCAIFASFTNIRVSDEYRSYSTNDDYQYVLDRIKNQYDKYFNIELKTLEYVEEQHYSMNYDINDIVYEWCNAEDELQCKTILQKVYDKELFVGEFVKALMKINNISNEMEKTCDLIGNVKLKNSLSKIPDMTLKYIATNQSLYI